MCDMCDIQARKLLFNTEERKPTMNEEAMKFATSMRGLYIIAQALHYGIEVLKQVPEPYREVSNISDMEYLQEHIYLFPILPEAKIIEVESITAKLISSKTQ